jgi:hypothetical protein
MPRVKVTATELRFKFFFFVVCCFSDFWFVYFFLGRPFDCMFLARLLIVRLLFASDKRELFRTCLRGGLRSSRESQP